MVYAGIDIGSAFAKAVIIDDGGNISHRVVPSGGNYRLTAEAVLREVLGRVGLSPDDIGYTVATGYGSGSVPDAGETVTDISADGRGISHLFPSVRTVIDIGGQYTRVFKLDSRGRPTDFLLSEKCASGSGRFLQIIAHVLQLELEDIGELSLTSQKRVDFNAGCAVFAESEAVSRIAEGTAPADILAGLHRALAAKIDSMVSRVKLEPDCAAVGGGARDIGLIRSTEERLGLSLLVPGEPQIVAALGAALMARERASGRAQ